MKVRFLILLTLICSFSVRAGEITLSGVYQGKNLYVQNPFTGNMQDFCANKVFVNGEEVMKDIKSSAFEVDLSHLKMGESVTIKITHKDDCKPKVLNTQVIQSKSSFDFKNFKIKKESISWSTKGEKEGGKLFLEQFINNNWETVKELQGQGTPSLHTYSVESHHHSGVNKYRVKYVASDGQVYYSDVKKYESDLEKVTFYPKRVSTKIYLSRKAEYEILDAYGNSVKSGKGDVINCSDLKQDAVYYLNVDNRTYKFLKK